MLIPVLELPEVWHVGTLRAADRGRLHSTSLEGAGLSVSLCPEAWQAIARLGGSPIHRMAREGSVFLDILGLDEPVQEEIRSWSIAEGLAEACPRFVAWNFDDEDDCWRGTEHATADEALDELMGDEPDDFDGDRPPPGGSRIQITSSLLLTAAGSKRSMAYSREVDGFDIVAMFWAEDVLAGTCPDLVGVWWQKRFDPGALSAPRGALFPDRLKDFRASQDEPDEDEALLSAMPMARLIEWPRAHGPSP